MTDMNELPPLDAIEPTPFDVLFADLAGGVSNKDATEAIAEVVQAVQELGRAGKVAIVLTIAPEGDNGRYVNISAAVQAKPPLPGAPGSILFYGPGGSVHKSDPYQRAMFNGDHVNDLADSDGPAREV